MNRRGLLKALGLASLAAALPLPQPRGEPLVPDTKTIVPLGASSVGFSNSHVLVNHDDAAEFYWLTVKGATYSIPVYR